MNSEMSFKVCETPAKGVRGFILWSPVSKSYFFRVYNDDYSFIDYDLRSEEIKVEILDNSLSLYQYEDKFTCCSPKLDWSQKVLKGSPGEKVVRSHIENGRRIEQYGYLDDKLEFIPVDSVKPGLFPDI